MSDNDGANPRLLGGRYRLEASLGAGGMGVVYRATDLTMHRAVAVKLVRAVDGVALDEEVAGRFLREAKNTARIQHENIIEVYDLGRTDGDMFFVMELLEGESLSTMLRRQKRLAPQLTVHIARQMCAALHVAHSAGVIHRDLKPANVMLVRRGSDRNYVKVLDFGVSKSYSADQQTQLTHSGMLVGTLDYMAPEQIMARKVDGRTDIYSLGVVMYRMLTGHPPFRDVGVPALIHAHLNSLPKSMSESHPEIPVELDRVILRCLAKLPEQRYASMEDVSRALLAAVELHAEAGDGRSRPAGKPRKPPLPSARESDEPTTLVDRPSLPAGARRPPAVRSAPDDERTAVMVRNEPSPAAAEADSVTRVASTAPRECSMCRMLNPPRSRACSACGSSLASDEQEAVRARVAEPAAQPHVPPPSAPYAASASPPSFVAAPPPFTSSAHPPFGVPAPAGGSATQPSVPWPPPAASSKRTPSLWHRLLVWTGLRGP